METNTSPPRAVVCCLKKKMQAAPELTPTANRHHLTFTVVQHNGLFHFCIAVAQAFLEGFCVGLQEMYNIHPVDLGEAFNEDSI